MSGHFGLTIFFDEDWMKELQKNLKNNFSYLKFNSRIQNICKGILNELHLND